MDDPTSTNWQCRGMHFFGSKQLGEEKTTYEENEESTISKRKEFREIHEEVEGKTPYSKEKELGKILIKKRMILNF